MIGTMISVIIPTLNAQVGLARTLAALVPAAIDGFVSEVIVADGGSSDATAEIADDAGAEVIHCEKGRGCQLATGAQAAKGRWLLFLHADTILEPGWEPEAYQHIRDVENGDKSDTAAAFRFALDDRGKRAAYLQWMVGLRCRILKLPYGDQGLLISRRLYDEIGGFKPVSLMEDVDLIRRLGRRRITMFRSAAVTSAERYRQEGYGRRVMRNLACLSLYYLWVPPQVLARIYG
jgi:rSAM/selenodomain-associated transferase 2